MSSTSQQDLAVDGVFLLFHFVFSIKIQRTGKKKRKRKLKSKESMNLYYFIVLSRGTISREIEVTKREKHSPCRHCGFL